MGHISPIAVRDLVCKGIIQGVELTDGNIDFQCRPCILAKMKRSSVLKEREGEHAEEFGDEMHSDLWGPAQVKTFSSWSYFISFTDDWSRWTTMYLMKTKGEAFSSYQAYEAWLKMQLEMQIKCLHSDRGGEYMSDAFINYLDECGVERKLTIHDTLEENGVAEHLNQTLMEKV